ncbi:MAG TPA: dihydroneopterin aldolase [Vitreimonas sp.]|uniref:dihydroneopterin aldolase n=1 Tax=Vitreimonas sp. TaxID=3069702 RepID=UPI002D2D0598|nr:dihydroneopterin aldolase [Vitreimonas sp.]HYD88169.1 dihydroneopterin aldolase [Vitreimonas sp.]
MADLQIIRIEDAKALVRVGVPDPERANPQEVRISVAMGLAEPPDFVAHDRIGATLDYDRILHFIRDDLGAPAHLIETLADRVAGHCLSLDQRARWVEVTVKKPSVLSGDGMVAVSIRRERP